MIASQFQLDFDKWWLETTQLRQAEKNSQAALLDLVELYKRSSAEERGVLNRIFSEWIESGDETRRFDAIALVDQFVIRPCLPALLRYKARLKLATSPDAPYEMAKVKRALDRLGS